jgi:ABC-2 type transport system ATP-binding protein
LVQDQDLLLPLGVGRGRSGGLPRALHPLAVERLRVDFGETVAVDGVSFDVPSGTIVGLAGPNACGKTTTLRSIAGLVRPTSGTVRVEGLAAGTVGARGCLAYVPDEPTGLDELTVGEWTDLVGTLWHAGDAYARRRTLLLDVFGLAGHERVPLGALSHGRRRIVAVVAGVALDRPLLVVDEATAALDPEAAHVLREVLLVVAGRGGAVLLATQDLPFAESVCDRVVLLRDGAVVAAGTQPALRARFGASSLGTVFAAATGANARLEEVRAALRRL